MSGVAGVLYVDTSALMRALLEQDGELVTLLRNGPNCVTSELTFTEAPRTLWRAVLEKRITASEQQRLLIAIREFEAHCRVIPLGSDVLERAREQFPVEFVRTLDAIHLSSALLYANRVAPLTLVSTDKRMRDNAAAFGLAVLPEALDS